MLELDVRRYPLRALLVQIAGLGCVSAILGGPPCCAMSVLRHRPGGPRPVGSPDEPFGLSDLSKEECNLVDPDTCLVARMLCLHDMQCQSPGGVLIVPNRLCRITLPLFLNSLRRPRGTWLAITCWSGRSRSGGPIRCG